MFVILVSKNRHLVVPNVTKPKLRRYDNFLKSGSRSQIFTIVRCYYNQLILERFDGLASEVKAKSIFPSATITKDQYSKQNGETSGVLLFILVIQSTFELIEIDLGDTNDVPDTENFGHSSTPVETQGIINEKNFNSENNTEGMSVVILL